MTLAQPISSPTVPFVPWDEFYASLVNGPDRWNQGEHVALIGVNGSGKTTLAYWILPLRQYVTILATKPEDESLDRFGERLHFHRIKEWKRNMSSARYPKRILWPPITNLDQRPQQRAQLNAALRDIYGLGGWCVYIDELYYLSQDLQLAPLVKTYLLQARSNRISLVLATQRPAWVPLETYSQATHLFFWRTRDAVDLQRIQGIASHDSSIVRDTIKELDFKAHEFLYVNQRSGSLLRSAAPKPEGR